jgi:hypothetical protein
MPVPPPLRMRVLLGVGATLIVLAAAEAWGLVAGEGDAVARIEDYELHRARHLTRRDVQASIAPLPAS